MRAPLFAALFAGAMILTAAGADSLPSTEIAAARKVYVAKCAKCHRFYEPTDYPEPAWRGWMEKMAAKSKLKPDQAALLDRYLDAYRAGHLTDKPHLLPRPAQAPLAGR